MNPLSSYPGIKNLASPAFFFILLVINAGLSLLAVYVDPLPNPDAIDYLITAEIFQDKGYSAAAEEYRRPFYSLLIAWIHQFTHLSILDSAYLLNILLVSAIVFLAPSLTKELGGSRQACLYTLLLILLNPSLNNYRSYIIRDFGYWTFVLLALIYFLRYIRLQRLRHAVLWVSSLLVAAAFRPDAVIYLLLMPVSILFLPGSVLTVRLTALGVLWLTSLFIAMTVAGALSIFGGYDLLASIKLQLLDESVHHILVFRDNFLDNIARYRASFINGFPDDSAATGFMAGLLVIFISKALGALSPFYSLLLINGMFYRHYRISAYSLIPLLGVVFISALIILVNFINTGFLQGRFTFLIALLIIPLIGISLEKIYLAADQGRQIKLFRIALVFFSTAIFADSFISFGYSKTYISESLQWVQTQTAPEARIYSNDKIISYLSERPFDWDLNKSAQQPYQIETTLRERNYDYWIIHSKKKNQPLNDWLLTLDNKNIEHHTFQNKRGDKVTVYKMSSMPALSTRFANITKEWEK